jgi:3-oxoacyl-[acyl-carrier protein] reductase
MGSLSNKVALVTGGARGIGAAIAKRLSEEGAAVSITYSKSKKSAEALVTAINNDGGRALAIDADSAEAGQVKAAVDETVRTFGGLDILVNNAGILRLGWLSTYSLDDLDEIIAVNIKGLFVATQEAIRHMGKGGRVINIGSISSDYIPIGGNAAYAMTKGAVASLTRGLARDLGPFGITVNNVQPGRIDTDMVRAAVSATADKDRIIETIALQRFGTSNEVAGLVAYLASPEAAFVTGANLKIDGGASL